MFIHAAVKLQADLAARVTSIKIAQTPNEPAAATDHLVNEQKGCIQAFEQWGVEEQVLFVNELLARMCHDQHGQVNLFLKPMLQRDFISALPGERCPQNDR